MITGEQIWATLTAARSGDNLTEAAIVKVLDLVLERKEAEFAFNSMAVMNNMSSMHRNTRGEYPANQLMKNVPLYTAVQDLNMSVSTTPVTGTLMQALVEPNIAGIPISSASVDTDREIEVSESMVIVQSEQTRKYWTDNAVPHLKTWSVQGYLTSVSPLDTGTLIKPSLQWQAYYLDICASSRRPVTFKTNRGEFVKVQITNLHTVEEASYNNVIKVELQLKEYNPYFVTDKSGSTVIATKVGSHAVEVS